MAKKRIRIYFDFDGTLTPVSGYEAVQTGIPKAFKDGVNTPEARAKLLKDKNFDGAKFGLEQKAKTFILSLIELKKNNPDVEIDMVIVSRNYGDYIRAILERGGIDLITFDQIYDTTSTFKNGKGEPVADHERQHEPADYYYIFDDSESDLTKMSNVLKERKSQGEARHAESGQFPFDQIGKEVESKVVELRKPLKEEKTTQDYEEKADIAQYPAKITTEHQHNQITKGDLHGNTLNLLHFLVKEGVVEIDVDDYKQFAETYTKIVKQYILPIVPDKDSFKTIKDILINKVKVSEGLPKDFIVRLIGDELADRGACDYFTLLMFKKLGEGGVQLETLFSNHGVEFIEAIESDNFVEYVPGLKLGQANSLVSTQELVKGKEKLIEVDELKKLYEENYKPRFKALSYTLSTDEKSITLYTHAPVNLMVVKAIAGKLNVEYKDDTAVNLAASIDRINDVFQRDYVKTNKIKTLYSAEKKMEQEELKLLVAATGPFYLLMWHREEADRTYKANRIANHNNFNITYVHGHDGNPVQTLEHKHIINLNSKMGQFDNTKGEYVISKASGQSRVLGLEQVETRELNQAKQVNKVLSKPVVEDLLPDLEEIDESQNISIIKPTTTIPPKGEPKPGPVSEKEGGFFAKIENIKKALLPENWKFEKRDEEKNNTPFVVTQKNGKGRFEIHPGKLVTRNTEIETFKTMLLTFYAAYPEKIPQINTYDEEAKKHWQQAYTELKESKKIPSDKPAEISVTGLQANKPPAPSLK